MMHQSEFDAANVALSRAADKRKSLINIHKNRYTATLSTIAIYKHTTTWLKEALLLFVQRSNMLANSGIPWSWTINELNFRFSA